jgi:hypothetical protein
MKTLFLAVLMMFSANGAPTGNPEEVKLDYELLLNRCKENSCHSETGARGELYIFLEEEDPTNSWGYSAVEQQAGSLAYQLRFNVSRELKEKNIVRKLTIGLSGRIGTLRGKQLTWGEKEFVGKTWNDFKMASASGTTYSEAGETITPTLKVLQVRIFP